MIENAGDDAHRATEAAVRGVATSVVSAPNKGYGHACNLGAGQAQGEILLILNADVEFERHALAMAGDVVRSPGVGIVGFDVFDAKSRAQRSPCRFRFPHHPVRIAWNLVFRPPPTPVSARTLELPVHEGAGPLECDWCLGAALIMRRDLYQAVGGFDERFFLYFEEIDLCRRVRTLGQRVVVVPGARIFHMKGAATRSLSPHRQHEIRFASQCYYFRKHYGVVGGIATLDDSLLRWRL